MLFRSKIIFISFLIINIFIIISNKGNIKVALCTMGKDENIYIKEFINYYVNFGIDHIFIYDDNELGTESFSDVIKEKYKNIVTIYKTKTLFIDHQSKAFTHCYKNNINKYDWFLMVDMDEFLYIIDDTLKSYLTKTEFDKCDFIKFHWVIPTDNNLIYYDIRPLFERFKPPYFKSKFVKSIIRGNISDLLYGVHSPNISPKRNITCNNEGNIIYYENMNLEQIWPVNIKRAYIIHFKYKSTEEFVNKINRGYKNWFGEKLNEFLLYNVENYFHYNKPTLEKINFIENHTNLNLTELRKKVKILF